MRARIFALTMMVFALSLAAQSASPPNPKIAATVPYYDNDYFAKRVKCDAFFTTGLIDLTCHPCTVMAAYNSLGSKRKQLLTFPKYAHVFGADKISNDTAEQFVRDRVERVKGKGK